MLQCITFKSNFPQHCLSNLFLPGYQSKIEYERGGSTYSVFFLWHLRTITMVVAIMATRMIPQIIPPLIAAVEAPFIGTGNSKWRDSET